MLIKKSPGHFKPGLSTIASIDGSNKETLLEFGILLLEKGQEYSEPSKSERAFGLIAGEAVIIWSSQQTPERKEGVTRKSIVEESPTCLHVPAGVDVKIRAVSDNTELYIFGVGNVKWFDPVFYPAAEVRKVKLKSGSLSTTERELRIIADDENAPYSGMLFGECLNHPGKWSSYPPHHHPHPEIYHYRFEPENGFGYAGEGDDVFLVRSGDTLLIEPHKVHPQTAAPGYSMVYIWAMPHLAEERFGGESRRFVSEHSWLLKK
jgi:5-deoxy-glucuronate isomerase